MGGGGWRTTARGCIWKGVARTASTRVVALLVVRHLPWGAFLKEGACKPANGEPLWTRGAPMLPCSSSDTQRLSLHPRVPSVSTSPPSLPHSLASCLSRTSPRQLRLFRRVAGIAATAPAAAHGTFADYCEGGRSGERGAAGEGWGWAQCDFLANLVYRLTRPAPLRSLCSLIFVACMTVSLLLLLLPTYNSTLRH